MPFRVFRVARAALMGLLGCVGCGGSMHGGGGVGQQSVDVGDQFIVLASGYAGDKVTWVAVRDFPKSSTPDERLADKRVTVGAGGGWLIRRADGRSMPPDSRPMAYLFEGERLSVFPIDMAEDDYIGFRTGTFRTYGDFLAFFRRYERAGKLGWRCMGTPELKDWFRVTWDERSVSIEARPPGREAWSASFEWSSVVRVCFKTEDMLVSDG